MRLLIQRVSRAEVRVGGRVTGRIGSGFCLLVGFTHSDSTEQLAWMAEKVIGLRLFGDAEGKMNLGLDEVDGALLVVSQFTLYGDARKGRRPSFIDAARPEVAIPLYERFAARRRELLTMIGIRHQVIAADIDEAYLPGEVPLAHAERLAREKGSVVAARNQDAL